MSSMTMISLLEKVGVGSAAAGQRQNPGAYLTGDRPTGLASAARRGGIAFGDTLAT